jgi:hypothetical protein
MRDEVLRSLPASARPYEKQRLLAAYGDPDAPDDGPDEDLEFLEQLVDEIDRTPAPAEADRRVQPAPGDDRTEPNLLRARPSLAPAKTRPAATPSISVRVATDDEQSLNVFRAVRGEPERVRTAQDLGVRDVDLADLLEDLSTTAAAIRRRKAA